MGPAAKLGGQGKVVPPSAVVLPPPMEPAWHEPAWHDPSWQGGYEGTIVSFRAEKNFGFIKSDQLGCDAFLSSHQIGTFNVGDWVKFDVTYNAQGKPQAQNLRPPEGGQQPPMKRLREW